MDEAEVLRIERAYRRIHRGMIGLAAAGTLALWVWKGWPWGTGFAAGAAASAVNFRWLEQVTAALAGRRTRKRTAVLFGLRYVLAGAAGYGIVKVFGLSGLAILCGLLVAAAAVLVEMVYELIDARA